MFETPFGKIKKGMIRDGMMFSIQCKFRRFEQVYGRQFFSKYS